MNRVSLNYDMKDTHEDAQLGASALEVFFNQFGSDIYAVALLEVLMEGLETHETLFVFGESEKGRDQTGGRNSG